MSEKKQMWRTLSCLVILSLLVLTTTGFLWDWGSCTRSQRWEFNVWQDTWGWHLELRKVTVWLCTGGGGAFCGIARAGAAADQPEPVIAMQMPLEYLGVPYPWQVVITPEGGTGQTFVISAVPIYEPSIDNELEAQWPSPPGMSWRVYGADPGDLARIQEALPPSGPFEVRAEGVFSFHAAVIEPTVLITEFDPVTQEWIPAYTYAPEVPLVFEPHRAQKVRPGSKVTFTHTLTNTATTARTFDLSYDSALGWDYVLSLGQAPHIPVTNTGPVAPDEAVDILVSAWVPLEDAGAVETVVVTATAQDDAEVTATVVDRVYVGHVTYLPIIRSATG